LDELIKEFARRRSNRTIVGLKRLSDAKLFAVRKQQQSHHCGIETVSADKFARIQQIAAIAPLWD